MMAGEELGERRGYLNCLKKRGVKRQNKNEGAEREKKYHGGTE